MIRRLVTLLGLLSLTACTEEPEPPPPTTGTVSGTLKPFSSSAAAASAAASRLKGVRPAMLNDPELRRQLAQAQARLRFTSSGARGPVFSAAAASDVDSIPGDVIVRFEEDKVSEADALARVAIPGYRAVHKGYITGFLHLIGYESLQLRSLGVGETASLARAVAGLQGVRYAEKNVRAQAFKVPNDPGYARQWHYAAMNLPAAWDVTTGTERTVNIAVVDTGIVKHPDLDARVVAGADLISDATAAGDGDGRDSDPTDMGKDGPDGSSSWHGSHVAGTIGAVTNDGKGVAGVTWSGRIIPVRVLGRSGGSFADIAAGISWASGGSVPGLTDNKYPAEVINMSLGGESPPSAALQEVIDKAVAKGTVIVVAAGNSDTDGARFSPCNQQNVICVGATRYNGKRASYSNFGTAVDVMATGGETAEDLDKDGKPDGVLSTILDSDGKTPIWAYYQGTSMASPHVAGIVGLMKSVNASLTASQAEQILQDTADPASKCSEGCGTGLINAQAAVLKAKNGLNPDAAPRLGVSSTTLSFTRTDTQPLAVRNLGGRSLKVTARASGAKASLLSFPAGNSVSLSSYSSTSLNVAVNASGLAAGDYLAQVDLAADNGESTSVSVRLSVSASSGNKDALLAFGYTSSDGKFHFDKENFMVVKASSGYAYKLDLAPRAYYALASIDDDGNGEYFDDTDSLGVWRDVTNFEAIDVVQGQSVSNISFAILPSDTSGDLPSDVGEACLKNSDCDTGLCNTSYPSGYCTQDCLKTGECPDGSGCFSLDGNKTAYCLVDCTGTGQGTCRTGYQCAAGSSGAHACIPN